MNTTYVRLELTQGKMALVDEDIWETLLIGTKWRISKHGNIFYARMWVSKNVDVTLHDFIMKPAKGFKVDHINHDGLDCRLENMRIATHNQNMWNSRVARSKKYTKYKGIFWDKNRQLWIVQINAYNKRINGGIFKDEIEAAQAADLIASKHHGEFAFLNFPGEPLRTDLEYISKKTSQYKGVHWDNTRSEWRAQGYANGKVKNIGGYKTEIQAHNAYEQFVNKNNLLS